MNRFTHTGTLKISKFGITKEVKVELRETKCYWITPKGSKYRKGNGDRAALSVWDGVNQLQLDTLERKQ